MKRLIALGCAVLALLVVSPSARADTFRIEYDATAVDPAETFEADCLGATQADDCDTRAALIEADLVLLLAQLQNDSDPATLALFQDALQLDSPIVQKMATQYVTAAAEQPQGFLAKVKTFFFGSDAPLGAGAAQVLESSADTADVDLAKLYGEQRDRQDYAPQAPPPEGEDSQLLQACIKDARLDLMTSFSDDEQFQPATRLLMYDRFVHDGLMPMEDYPVTAFVTDASMDDVSAFFDEKLGKSYGPYADAESRIQELSMELLTLQQAAASGDKAAIAKLTAAVMELTQAQSLLTLGAALQLQAIHAENDLVWLDGKLDDLGTSPVRAVTAGADAALGQTVIRYISAPPASGATTPGSGGESSSAGGVLSGNEGDVAGEGGADGNSLKKSDGGCGCTLPRGSAPSVWLALLATVMLLARRRRWGET